MKKLKVFETFAGIGAQHKALSNIFNNKTIIDKFKLNKKTFEIVGTSEWYIEAIIAYDAIHHGNQSLYIEETNFNMKDMLTFIKKFSLSKDSKDLYEFSKIEKLPENKIKQLYIALKRNKNYGSIVDIKAKDLPFIDLLTYSFPCTDISNAGQGKGLSKCNQNGSCSTRSGLLWEIERILLEMKELNRLPKFLLMENVKALLSEKHYKDWLEFEKVLESLGYRNSMIVLNAQDFGIPQTRERIFCVSELNGKTNINIRNWNRFNSNLGDFLDIDEIKYQKEYEECIPNNTPSRIKTFDLNTKLTKDSKFVNTITTKQDRSPNAGNFYYDNNLDGKAKFRFITPRECLMLMGFDKEDYDKLKEINMKNEEIYKQTGNSIVVQKLEAIFIEILSKF